MERDDRILDAAADLARTHGLLGFHRGQVADAAGMSRASVSNYERTSMTNNPQPTAGALDRIRSALMARAIEQGDLQLVAMGIAARHPLALDAPSDLRIAAMTAIG